MEQWSYMKKVVHFIIFLTFPHFSLSSPPLYLSLSVELLANERLTRTFLIYPHSNILSQFKIDHKTLRQQVRNTTLTKNVLLMLSFPFQIGFAYGCGQLCHLKKYKNNAIRVPNATFPYKDDQSRYSTFKFSNINMNFIIFIGLNPFIVIYTQKLPYVIN